MTVLDPTDSVLCLEILRRVVGVMSDKEGGGGGGGGG